MSVPFFDLIYLFFWLFMNVFRYKLAGPKKHVVEQKTVFNTSILLTTNFNTGSVHASFPTCRCRYAVIEN